MYRIFAVLFFLFIFVSCSKQSITLEETNTYSSVLNNNSIYSTSGDFNGDNKPESLYLTKVNKDYYLTIKLSDKLLQKKLEHKLENYQINIEDINYDKHEDIIISITEDGCQNCYAYTIDKEINLVVSPDHIQNTLLNQYLLDSLAVECYKTQLKTYKGAITKLQLYFTELDYEGDDLVFNTEGSITIDNDRTDIKVLCTLDSQYNLHLQDLKIIK